MYNTNMYATIKSKILNLSIIIFPLIFATIIIWIRINHYSTYEIIGQEDHIIEYSQFFFFLGGGIFALLIALKFRKFTKLMFVVFLFVSLGLIFIAGEEISWGERLLNIQTPEVFDGETEIPFLEYNVQGEMNFHNFKPIHNIVGTLYLIVGFYFIFAWIFVNGFNKFWRIKESIKAYLPFLVPSPILTLYFVPVAINLFDVEKTGFPPQDYEMVEFLLSLGILIFLIMCYKHLAKDFTIPKKS